MRLATKSALLTGFVLGQLFAYGAVSLTDRASAAVAPVPVRPSPILETASAPSCIREISTPDIREIIEAMPLPILTVARGEPPMGDYEGVPLPGRKPGLAAAGLM